VKKAKSIFLPGPRWGAEGSNGGDDVAEVGVGAVGLGLPLLRIRQVVGSGNEARWLESCMGGLAVHDGRV